jgi:hypothetical protein
MASVTAPLPRIFVWAPDMDTPTGGIKKMYHHVDILNKYGFPAWIVHAQRGFRCTWFPHSTPVLAVPDLQVNERDFLVLSETWGPGIGNIAPGIRKVILNQNAYYTFRGYGVTNNMTTPYSNPDVVAALVVSEDSRQFLNYVFPKLRVFRLNLGFDLERFSGQRPKRKLISFMPRKHAEEVEHVINALKFRGALQGWSLAVIKDMPERELVDVLEESMIFLSFGYPEGCPAPPAEAMAAGCVVIGYHGWGGREYFKPEFCYPVETADVTTFAQTVERVIQELERDSARVQEKARQASQYVKATFTRGHEEADVVAAWRELTGLSAQNAAPLTAAD